jgi:hypothetical protein
VERALQREIRKRNYVARYELKASESLRAAEMAILERLEAKYRPAPTQHAEFRQLPSIDEILLNPATASVPTETSAQIAVATALGRVMTDSSIGRGLTYLELFSNLSDGQRIMLTLIGDLVRRIVMLNPHLGDRALLETPGVVLIDELDLHLHPKWQRRVIHDLKKTFPCLQFVATTHSPQLVGEALPEEIRILENGGVFRPKRSFGVDSSEILEEVMKSSRRNIEIDGLLKDLSEFIDREDITRARQVTSSASSLL